MSLGSHGLFFKVHFPLSAWRYPHGQGAVLVLVCSGVSQGPLGTVSTGCNGLSPGCNGQAGLGCGASSSRWGDIFHLMCVGAQVRQLNPNRPGAEKVRSQRAQNLSSTNPDQKGHTTSLSRDWPSVRGEGLRQGNGPEWGALDTLSPHWSLSPSL